MKMLWRTLRWVVVVFFASTLLAVLAYRFVPVPLTPLMVIRYLHPPIADMKPKLEHEWVPLDSISPYLPVAVIASEDQNFLQHNGFDFTAINAAAKEQLRGGRKRGGSTISQQTAKNVFLWPESSWLRKGFEVYFTVLIELMWPKERIVEVYLNSIEMGPGIYGAEAVAREHFGCSAADLKRSDCALIAATLPNPIRFSSKEPSKYMKKRQRKIEKEMKHIDFLKK